MGTCEVKADVVRNRLYVTLKGFSDDDEARQNAKRVVAEIAKLRPGFSVVSDISELKARTSGGTRGLEETIEAYRRHGVGRVVRVVGKEVVGKMQFDRVSREAGLRVDYVATLAEAERLLDAAGTSTP
jgi:hypothetical protein